jgi:hypothetical protein
MGDVELAVVGSGDVSRLDFIVCGVQAAFLRWRGRRSRLLTLSHADELICS